MSQNENIKLTDEQIEDIANQMDEEIKGTNLEKIAQFPSNQGKEERTAVEVVEKGELKKAAVLVDPNTGEHKIIGPADDSDNESFEEMCERIQNQDINLELAPISEEEIIKYIAENKDEDSSVLSEMCADIDISPEAIRDLLVIVNRKLNKEDFNVYKAFPDEIKAMVDKYLAKLRAVGNSMEVKQIRNLISESLIEEFISNISLNRMQSDFNKEIETLFTKGANEIAESIVGYTQERNKTYREYAEKMEDPVKKEKVLNILDRIDEAFNLTELKEFAKKCKVKKFDLEKPGKIFDSFLMKYVNSTYSIYDINLARPILWRNINTESETYTDKDINAFFIVFCKQCMNMSPEIVLDHAYMYYVIYNIVLMDMNKGETKQISDEFLDNVREVIKNIKERNNI